MPDSGDGESGLFRSDRVNVTSLIQQFLKAVFLRAAIMITIFWFVMYAALKSVNKLIGLLPKFTIKWKSDKQTGQD